MTSFVDVESLVVARLLANLPTGFLSKNIRYPNAPFDEPKPPADVSNANAIKYAWLSIYTEDLNSEAESPCYEMRSGILALDLYWPKFTGSVDAKNAIEHINTAFKNSWLNEQIKINLGVIKSLPDTNWYNLNLTFDYFYEV